MAGPESGERWLFLHGNALQTLGSKDQCTERLKCTFVLESVAHEVGMIGA